MVLLDAIIEVGISSVHDISAQRLANGTWIGIMSISCHPFWGMADSLESLLAQIAARHPYCASRESMESTRLPSRSMAR